jgi:hypothetical protein
VALMLAGIATFALGVYELTATGSCTIMSARACGSDDEVWTAALVAGLFAFLAGGALSARSERRVT